MTKEELDKIKKHLLVGGEIGLPHYSHKTTVDKTVLDQLVRGVESLHQQLEAAHAFHDVAVKQRDEARAEVERLQARVATQDDGLRYGEKVCADLMAEINGLHKKLNALEHAEAAMMCETDKLRAERRLLRDRLVACAPFVGICPREPDRIQLMRLVRDLAEEVLEEVQ